jgi:hypothetical protein|nr:carboxypeptidase regulatory-like domain-containing protein [Kofleriaceae bacterium]
MQNRKVVGAVIALAVAAFAVYWFGLRTDDRAAATATADTSRDGKVTAGGPTLPGESGGDAPLGRSGRFSRWSVDNDPDGPLRLEGQVVGPDGRGVGSAEVWLDTSPDQMATTDGDGSFAFEHVVGRTYSLSSSHGDLIGATTYKLAPGSDPAVIRLGEGAHLVVTAVDDDKRPVAHVHVVARDSQRETETDDVGKATLTPVHPGWIVVEGRADGFANARAFVTIGSAGASGDVKLIMHKGVAVSGRVVDEKGAAIARAHVTSGDDWGGSRSETDCDTQGKFTLMLPKGVHSLGAVDGSHAPATSAAFLVGDKPVDNVEIKLLVGGRIKGVVLDRDAKPVAFATVHLVANSDGAGGGRRRGPRSSLGASRTATTSRDGTFELRGLPRVKLSARADSADTASKLVDVDLEAAAAADDVKLVLDVSGVIRGVVVDDTGQPVPEVSVHAVPDVFGGAGSRELMLSGLSSTTSDGGGGFAITGLPDGSYRLWAQRTSQSTSYGEGQPAKTGDKDVKVILPATGTLVAKLALSGASGAPHLATVMVGYQAPTPIDGGAVTVKDLAPGSYDVTFRGAEFASFVQHDVEIKPNHTTDLGTITLPKGRTLTGTVVDTANNPVGGAKVKLGVMMFSPANSNGDSSDTFDDMMGVRNTVSDTDGTFTLTGVPVRATNVIADHPDRGRSVGMPVAAGTDDPPPMTLVVHGYGSITGKVVQGGQPVGNVQISDSQAGGGANAQFASTASDGSFVISKAPEGPHVLSVMRAQFMGLRTTSQNVDVVAGQPAVVTIDIPQGNLSLAVTIKPIAGAEVDLAQVFLFHGNVQFPNGRALVDAFFTAGLEGMKFWISTAPAPVQYDELVAGSYSVCGLPVTGSVNDPKLMQRLQEDMELLKVYCKPVVVATQPQTQAMELDLPAMQPLPPPS